MEHRANSGQLATALAFFFWRLQKLGPTELLRNALMQAASVCDKPVLKTGTLKRTAPEAAVSPQHASGKHLLRWVLPHFAH